MGAPKRLWKLQVYLGMRKRLFVPLAPPQREFMKGFERRNFPMASVFDRPPGPQPRVKCAAGKSGMREMRPTASSGPLEDNRSPSGSIPKNVEQPVARFSWAGWLMVASNWGVWQKATAGRDDHGLRPWRPESPWWSGVRDAVGESATP